MVAPTPLSAHGLIRISKEDVFRRENPDCSYEQGKAVGLHKASVNSEAGGQSGV